MKETDLYRPIKDHFEQLGYEIYSEVETKYAGGRVDVVAYAAPAAVAIELKTSLTVDLIEQAVKRQTIFPYVYIAIPQRRQPIAGWLQDYLKAKGIGVLEVKARRAFSGYDLPASIDTTIRARYRKPLMQGRVKWSDHLKEEHKTWVEGGNAGGGHVTPYRLTMVGVRNFLYRSRTADEAVEKNAQRQNLLGPITYEGWRNVKEILDHCETHYQTPKSSLAKALLDFESDWVECKKEAGRLWFRHKEG